MVSECPHVLFILTAAIKICFEIKARGWKTTAMFSPYSLSILTLEILQKTLEVFMF